MKTTQINRFDLFQVISLLFAPALIAFALYKVIPIQNMNPLSIVSVTASINAIIWSLIVLQISINYLLINKYSIKLVVHINLILILVYVSAFKVLIKALALKGTPLSGTDIRGDLLNVVNLAKIAKQAYWAGGPNPIFPDGGYPPIWPSLIGNIARILDVHVLYIFKPAEFVLLLISPILVLFMWRLIFNTWMSLVITINQTLIYNFDYKTLTLNLILPLLIFIVVNLKTSSKSKIFIYGLTFGITSLTYFGYIYWLIPFMMLTILVILFSDNKEKYFTLNAFLYLGLGAGLGPVIYFRLTENIYVYYLAILASILFLVLLEKYRTLKIFSLILINTGLFSGLLGAFLFFRTKDSWVEGGIEKSDPTGVAILNLSGMNLIFLIIFLIGIVFIMRTKEGIMVILSLVGVYLSSTIFMYLVASQMQVTSRVDLWPRAREVQNYSLNLIFLIILLYVVNNFLNEPYFRKYLELSKLNLYYLVSSILIIVGSYLVSSLGALTYGSMPYHSFGSAWFAHQGCSNPHEDPMLSKVFENNPDIQEFLRENCPSANWPKIPETG